jgi:hypothetical protein
MDDECDTLRTMQNHSIGMARDGVLAETDRTELEVLFERLEQCQT